MLSKKALIRHNYALLLTDSAIHLPIRQSVAENISAQHKSGMRFKLEERMYEKLDLILNLSLEKEYRAPSIKQVKLASLLSEHLDLVPDRSVLNYQMKTELFIEKYYQDFDALQFRKE